MNDIKITPITIDASSISKSIEDALVNFEIKKSEMKRPDLLLEHFLDCSKNDYRRYDIRYTGAISKLYQSSLYKYIDEFYTDCSKDILKIIKKNREISPESLSCMEKLAGSVGVTSCDLIRIDEHNVISSAKSGTIFIEDSNGFRYVLNLSPGFGINAGNAFVFRITCKSSYENVLGNISRFVSNFSEYVLKNPIFKKGVYSKDAEYINIDPVSWDELKLSKEIKTQIDFHILDFIKYIPEIRKRNLRCSRGIIFCGRPGNGKTLCGKVLASNLDIPVIWVTADDLNSFSPGNVLDELFQFANHISPAIIFIEDADIFFEDRLNGRNPMFLSEFLNRIDGLKSNRGIITILTCNNPELLDEAIKNRPKRFDAIIEFGNPEESERYAILSDRLINYIKKSELSLLDYLTEVLEGFSGAHITEFAERLCLHLLYEGKQYISKLMIQDEFRKWGFRAKNSNNYLEYN